MLFTYLSCLLKREPDIDDTYFLDDQLSKRKKEETKC